MCIHGLNNHREIGDLMKHLQEYPTLSTRLAKKLEITQEDVDKLQLHLDQRLLNIWKWLMNIMDSAESQLRFGASLTVTSSATETFLNHSAHRHHHRSITSAVTSASSMWGRSGLAGGTDSASAPTRRDREDANSARREFLSYSLSLMRAHNAEHLDSLPVIDVSSLKHVAYVFDSLIYFLRSGSDKFNAAGVPVSVEGGATTDFDNLIVHDPDEPDDMSFNSTISTVDASEYDEDASQSSNAGKQVGKTHHFFQRSDSTLCLGCPAPDPFQVCVKLRFFLGLSLYIMK